MNPSTDHHWEIIICKRCHGRGTEEHSELTDYHKGEYSNWDTICPACDGSGRMRISTQTITTTEPYDNPKVGELMFKKLKETDNAKTD